jgi:hypothetical protein
VFLGPVVQSQSTFQRQLRRQIKKKTPLYPAHPPILDFLHSLIYWTNEAACKEKCKFKTAKCSSISYLNSLHIYNIQTMFFFLIIRCLLY